MMIRSTICSRFTGVAACAAVISSIMFQTGFARQLATQPAGASNQAAAPKQNPTSPPPIKLGSVTLSGSLRARVEDWDWFDTSAADGDYVFDALVLRLSLGQQKERLDWFVEGEFPALIDLPDNAIAPAPQGQLGLGASYFAANGNQDASAFLKQAFVRFKGIGHDKPSSFRLGRFEFIEGAETTPADATLATLKRDHIAHRLIGNFGFSHVGRSVDGVQYARSTKASNFTLVAARPTEGVFQLRGMKELDVDFYYGAFTKPFTGKKANSEARLFGLHYHDGRPALKTDNRPTSVRQSDTENIRLTTVGGHYIGAIKGGSGTADILFWGAGQFGSWGKLDHRAGAIAAEAGYQFDTAWKPWVRGGYFQSTGDADPADGDHTTFFQVLPTPRIYARFPFYNLMNNQDVFAQLRLKPHPRLAIRADVRHLKLSNTRDLWYSGGGAFQAKTFGYTGRPSGGKSSLGTLADVSLDWVVAQRTSFVVYLGGVRGGGVQGSIYPLGGTNPGARFVYVELTQRF
ncbi:MAG TPA: alginate export family protein [Blastocatellia bacterium]|nr:alginate export family protein [Blastocatellia bacterium]